MLGGNLASATNRGCAERMAGSEVPGDRIPDQYGPIRFHQRIVSADAFPGKSLCADRDLLAHVVLVGLGSSTDLPTPLMYRAGRGMARGNPIIFIFFLFASPLAFRRSPSYLVESARR